MTKRDGRDAIARDVEWQEHLHDPGYVTGGRMHPRLYSRHPDREGYVFLLLGGPWVIVAIVAAIGGQLWGALLAAAFAALHIALGVVMLRQRKRPSTHKRKVTSSASRRR